MRRRCAERTTAGLLIGVLTAADVSFQWPTCHWVIQRRPPGWIQYWLDRMDAVYDSVMGRSVPLKERPSFYFRRNVWVSADPDEKSLPAMVDLCGSDRFFWATDFPHPDHTGNYIE